MDNDSDKQMNQNTGGDWNKNQPVDEENTNAGGDWQNQNRPVEHSENKPDWQQSRDFNTNADKDKDENCPPDQMTDNKTEEQTGAKNW